MKIARKIFQGKDRGYALLITIFFIALGLLMLGSTMNWGTTSALQTQRNNLFRASTGAADAATELVMAYMWRDFDAETLGTSNSYTGYLPNQTNWPVQFSFYNGAGVANQTAVNTAPANWTTNWEALNAFSSKYAGLSAYVAQCTITSTATTSNRIDNVSATVQQKFQLAAIPIFQFAVFYNLNMEIDPGEAMNLTGPVFSNDGIWARGLTTFSSAVSAAGLVYTNSTNPYLSGKSDSQQSAFGQGINTNVDTLTLPIGSGTTNSPTAARAVLGIPPAGTSPYSAAGQLYFENEADLIISNSPAGTVTAYYQDPDEANPLTKLPYDVTQVITNGSGPSRTYTTNSVYSFATNVAFYDFRENKNVNAVQLNVGALNAWMTNSAGSSYNSQMYLDSGHFIDSVYVYNNATATSSSLPATRVANGAVLPADGLTVVTPDPLYVLGNYNASGSSLNNGTNVANTAPAALIGDAITVLSPSWSDSYNASTALSSRTPTATTINAAAFEGIVPSNGTNYSGGVENFLRLMESWSSGVHLTYNGSIVVMFQSQYATNNWSYGSYYDAPGRNWAFDVNYLSKSGLPPLTPEVQAIIRQTWTAY